MRFAFWTLFPFLAAFLAAVILQRPVNFITRKTPLKRGITSVIMVFLLLLAIIIPLALVILRIALEFRGFADYIRNFIENLPEFLAQLKISIADTVAFLPDGVEAKIMDSVNSLIEAIANSGAAEAGAEQAAASFDFSFLLTPLGGIWDTAKQIPTALVGVLVAIISCCFMTSDYPRLRAFIVRQLPEHRRSALGSTKQIVFSSFGKMAKAYLIIMFITFCEVFIGLNILKMTGVFSSSYVFVISLVTAIVDIVPVLGTGTILVPWMLFSFLVGDTGLGIGLLVMYVVITVIRQVVEPKLVAGQLGLPAFLTVIAMFLGVKLFGFIGLFLLPMTIILLKLLNDRGIIHLWKRSCDVQKETVPAEAAEETPPADENKE